MLDEREMQGFEYDILGGGLLLSLAMLLVTMLLFSFRESWASRVGREWGTVRCCHLGWIDMAGVGLIFVFHLLSWINFGQLKGEEVATTGYLIGQMTLQGGFILMVFGLLYRRTEFEGFWGLKPARPYRMFAYLFGGFILYFLILEGLWFIGYQDWVKSIFIRVPLPLIGERTGSEAEFWFWWGVVTVLSAPFAEEVVFRGFLYPVLKRMGGMILAALTVSLFFAVVHLDGQHLLGRMVLSLILIGAYEITGSLWAPLGIHFLNNAYVFSDNFIA